MDVIANIIEKFRNLSPKYMVAVIIGKLLFGVGLGVFLVTYFQDYLKELYWLIFGEILIIISLFLHIPGWYKTFKNIQKDAC